MKLVISPFAAILVLLSVLFFSNIGCKKENLLTTGGQLSFSTDTLKFDTVFTTTGSTTRFVKLFNRNDKPVRINRISLEGGTTSFFRLNVDGEPTKDITNIDIAARDSIYIFVAVTIDPNASLLPFIIEDKVMVELNENKFNVALQAYGQNAHFIDGEYIQTSTWVNDKPYVIVNSAAVDTGAILTIQKGCRIYMHANSKLYVAGTLNVFGEKGDSVIFQGDRLDRDYFGNDDYPGEWRGIHFLQTSLNNVLSFAVIKNAGASDAAIYIEPPLGPLPRPMVEIRSSIIANSLSYGILCFNTWVRMENTLVHSCGLQNIAVVEGGTYDFLFCTFATYSSLLINHNNQPTMALLNYRDIDQTSYVSSNLTANLTNCIVYGSLETETVFANKGTGTYAVNLDHCLLKYASSLPTGIGNNASILNQDPEFADRGNWDYHISSTSPAKNAGIYLPSIIKDLDDLLRPSTGVSIGCYQ